MADAYVGEIRIFAGNFAPTGWAECSGQLLPIADNETLFNVIGTTYGGDGESTFALPDLRGRLAIGMGQGPGLSNRQIGEPLGVETVTITANQMPAHGHTMTKGTLAIAASSAVANRRNPSQAVYAKEAAGVTAVYSDATPDKTLAPNALKGAPATLGTTGGGGQPVSVLQPTLSITFIICLNGIFPSQT